MKINQRLLRSFRHDPSKQKRVWDEELKGFGLIANRDGTKTFVARRRLGPHGNQKTVTVGRVGEVSLDEARHRAGQYLDLMRQGIDPTERRVNYTFGDVLHDFKAGRQAEVTASTLSSIDKAIERLGALHATDAVELTRGQVTTHLQALTRRGELTARLYDDVVAWGRAAYNWTLEHGWLDRDGNPFDKIPKRYTFTRGEKRRVLKPAELRAVWRACDRGYAHDRIVRALMLTGGRQSEIGSLRWSEVDLEQRLILLPSRRTKARITFPIYITKTLEEQLPPRLGFDHVFALGTKDVGYSTWSQSLASLRKRVNLADPWTKHDFRHTFSTVCKNDLGIDPTVVELCYGHKVTRSGEYLLPASSDVYTHKQDYWHRPMRECWERWEGWLLEVTAED